MFKKYMNVEMVLENGTHCAWVNAENGKLYAIDADQNLLFSIFPILFWILPVKIYEVDYGEGGPSRSANSKIPGVAGIGYALGTCLFYLIKKFDIFNFNVSPILSIILAIIGGILVHLVIDKKKANFVIRKTFWCRYFPISILSIEYFIYYLIFVSIVFMSLFMLTYDSGNIILLLSCVVIVYGLFWMENFFIKGKMKLKIISEVTK